MMNDMYKAGRHVPAYYGVRATNKTEGAIGCFMFLALAIIVGAIILSIF
jgi:hypothetical protein